MPIEPHFKSVSSKIVHNHKPRSAAPVILYPGSPAAAQQLKLPAVERQPRLIPIGELSRMSAFLRGRERKAPHGEARHRFCPAIRAADAVKTALKHFSGSDVERLLELNTLLGDRPA